MSADTTAPSYGLNWKFLLCAIWALTSTVVSASLIWKYEGSKKSKTGRRDNWRDTVGSLYKDEACGTSLKVVRPAWLLAYRVTAFIMIVMLLITIVVLDGDGILYFYTRWTFTFVTAYFGISAGAVLLPDCVFWFIIYPFLTSNANRLGFVALSIARLIISVCSPLVLGSRVTAYSMLWHLCSNNTVETLFIGKIGPRCFRDL